MGDARTTLEAVFAETTGDILQLIEKVEAVDKQLEGLLVKLPAAADQMHTALKPTLDEIYAAIGRLQETAQGSIQAHKQALRQDLKEVREVEAAAMHKVATDLRNDLLNMLGRQVASSVSQSFEKDVVQIHIVQAVGHVKSAAKALDEAYPTFKAATQEIRQATAELNGAKNQAIEAKANVTWSIWKRLGAQLLVIVLGGLLALSLANLFGFGRLSSTQFERLKEAQQETLSKMPEVSKSKAK